MSFKTNVHSLIADALLAIFTLGLVIATIFVYMATRNLVDQTRKLADETKNLVSDEANHVEATNNLAKRTQELANATKARTQQEWRHLVYDAVARLELSLRELPGNDTCARLIKETLSQSPERVDAQIERRLNQTPASTEVNYLLEDMLFPQTTLTNEAFRNLQINNNLTMNACLAAMPPQLVAAKANGDLQKDINFYRSVVEHHIYHASVTLIDSMEVAAQLLGYKEIPSDAKENLVGTLRSICSDSTRLTLESIILADYLEDSQQDSNTKQSVHMSKILTNCGNSQ